MVDVFLFLRKKKAEFEKKLNQAGADDPFRQAYADGVMAYEEALRDEYKKKELGL